MSVLYNIGIGAYSLAARLAAVASPKIAKMVAGQKRTLATFRDTRMAVAPDGFDVWFHAASLGEFEQARPMIERLRAQKPQMKILLTFFSPSGYEVRKDYPLVDAVAYLPFDTPARVDAFLDAATPKMAVFVKYEFWGNYLAALSRRGIPTYIISAIFRPDQVFFRWYGGIFRDMLACFSHLYVQDDASRDLLASIGVDNVTVAGDTRFDRVTDIMRSTVEFPVIDRWRDGAQVLVAGSSWQPDEERYIPFLNANPAIKAIIAPHEFDDQRIAALRAQLRAPSITFSEAEKLGEIPADVQTVIVDCFGKLSSLYRYASVAIVGGGFGAGIHNINEAAVYGVPVVFGPRHRKFREAAGLIAAGGGFEYSSAADIEQLLFTLFYKGSVRRDAGAKAAAYISENLGATDRIFSDLFP